MLLDTLHRWENTGEGTCPVTEKAAMSVKAEHRVWEFLFPL